MAIVGALLALLLPALQATRERVQATACRDNLRSLGQAAQQHVATHGHLPVGGLGAHWMGVASRRFGVGQPGGWLYNLLPYLEQEALHSRFVEHADASLTGELAATMPSGLACPTRASAPAPVDPGYRYYAKHLVPLCARSDYAANAGTTFIKGPLGPQRLSETREYFREYFERTVKPDGVVWHATRVRPRNIEDGLSNTLLAAEKWIGLTESNVGHNQPVWVGGSLDVHRFGADSPVPDWIGGSVRGFRAHRRFGSRHVGGLQTVMAGGSSRTIEWTVEPAVFEEMCSRAPTVGGRGRRRSRSPQSSGRVAGVEGAAVAPGVAEWTPHW